MTRAVATSIATGALSLTLVACDAGTPFELAGGPVYDFRVVVEATAAGLLPGGGVQVFSKAGGVLDSLRLTLKGLAPLASGGYTLYSVDERTNAVSTARTGIAPDSLGNARTTVTRAALGSGTSVVLGFGAADYGSAFKPLYFQFRSPASGALTASGSLKLGKFSGTTSTSSTFLMPPSARWGRGGLWIDQPSRGDVWLRGYVLHVPLAPNGFQWVGWTVRLSSAGDTIKAAARLGLLTDSAGTAFDDPETAPSGAALPELPKAFFDGSKSGLNAALETFTHVFLTLEPRGAAASRPAPTIVYRGAFPRQYLLRSTQ